MRTRLLSLFFAGAVGATAADMPYGRLRDAAKEPGNWLTYSGSYAATRFSTLDEINTANVQSLRPEWVYQLPRPGTFECSPVVVDGVMYIAEPPTAVSALDARTGRRYWTWSATLPDDLITIGFPRTNRGVAVLDDMV